MKTCKCQDRLVSQIAALFLVTLVLSCRSTFDERVSGTAKVEVEFSVALGVLAECIGDDATLVPGKKQHLLQTSS